VLISIGPCDYSILSQSTTFAALGCASCSGCKLIPFTDASADDFSDDKTENDLLMCYSFVHLCTICLIYVSSNTFMLRIRSSSLHVRTAADAQSHRRSCVRSVCLLVC